jgi:hypothetical protein
MAGLCQPIEHGLELEALPRIVAFQDIDQRGWIHRNVLLDLQDVQQHWIDLDLSGPTQGQLERVLGFCFGYERDEKDRSFVATTAITRRPRRETEGQE